MTDRLKKNEEIRGKTLRIIGPDGGQMGIMLVEQARMKAKEMEMDLVEVAPTANPPVCRIMDFGKHIYAEQKKEHQARKKAHAQELKEVRLKPRIGKHDLEIKVNRAKGFLAEGNRVRFTMVYKGREITHQEIGERVLKEVVAVTTEVCKVERGPFREGRSMSLILAPKQHLADKPAPKAAAKPASKPASKPAASAPPAQPAAQPAPAAPVAAASQQAPGSGEVAKA